MKIKACISIVAPFKGKSFSFEPDDVGDVDDEVGKKLVKEGAAEKASAKDEITYTETTKLKKLGGGAPKFNKPSSRQKAVKDPAKKKNAAKTADPANPKKTKRRKAAELLGAGGDDLPDDEK